MANLWLCPQVIRTQLANILPLLLTLHILHTSIHPTTATATASISSEHRNTLIDQLEHEEFLDSQSQQPHSRRKRLVWITDDGRLALPPGTSLTFTPTIAMPLVRHPPEGFFSNVSMSFPLTIDFDKLGLTDESNPLGDLPPIFSRSFGRAAGRMLGEYVADYLHYRSKRDVAAQQNEKYQSNAGFQIHHEQPEMQMPTLPEGLRHVFHGGERAMLYGVVEDLLSTFGLNGKACLLRTICEVHSRDLAHLGMLGEITKLFLTVTKSPFADLMSDYVRAQEIGEGRQAPGECFPYYKECPRGIFKTAQRKIYRAPQNGEYHEETVKELTRQKLPENTQKAEMLETNEVEPQTRSKIKTSLYTM